MMDCIRSSDIDNFIRVEGKRFMLGDEPYCFVGINFWHAAYLGADIIPSGRERLVRELELLKSYGIDNLRVMASAEQSDLEMSVVPAFHLKPGKYNENLLTGLDFLLDELSRRDMKAVLVLNNYWQWSGGMAQYVNWATGDSIIDPDATNNWRGFMNYSAGFYYNEDAKQCFSQYLKHIIRRKNTINQTFYFKDPTIMAWELANEPRPHPESLQNKELLTDYYKWIDSTASYIHSLAPYQLVTTGSEGLAGSLHDSAIYFNTHRIPAVDYITFHLWPKNWGWFIAERQEETLPVVLENARKYCIQHVNYAEMLNKPTVLEEFGIGRDKEEYLPGTSVNARDTFLGMIYKIIEDNMQLGKPVAGSNLWTWGGEGRSHHPDASWIQGTDYTGDPPQEPQGLNSVFDVDSTTLEIMKKHSGNIEMIIK
ncbi:MAG: cellulase family glycosylhydrolase [Bacteroidales bacterium]|nr:cellulase family glycosylhydrolase [Bacteroidales bacterium]